MENINTDKFDTTILLTTINDLVQKFEPKHRFIHPNTLNNFIYHFDTFKDKRIKRHVYGNIFDLLELLKQVAIEDLNPKFGADIYDTYVHPLLHYYNLKQRFFIQTNWKYLVGFQVLTFLFLYIIKSPVYANGIALALFIGFFLYVEKKRKQKRLYGLFY